MAKNIVDKIWEKHIVKQKEGHPAVFAIDFMLMHEVTSAQAFDVLRDKGLKACDPKRFLATLDHSVPTRDNREEIYDDLARIQVETLRKNSADFDIRLLDYDRGQGVVHVVGPELGATHPGSTIVCGDSHTATHGAFGALAFGIGTSEVANVLATGCLLQHKPKTMKVEFKGSLKKGVYAKDAVLKLIAEIGVGGATGHIIEYTGDLIKSLDMAARMTICNMSIECGARGGLIAPDETTFSYLKGREYAPEADKWAGAVEYWKDFLSDEGCTYDRELAIDVSALEPMITWGTNPAQGIEITGNIPKLESLKGGEKSSAEQALKYVDLKPGAPVAGTEIQWAFVGSCTNGRIEDLRIAADIVKGRKVSEGVSFYVVPGSEAVRAEAIKEGLDEVFRDAGAQFRMPGCSMCLAMNDDKVPAGERCISSSNRNFVGRQGTGSRTHLASPATVAASALEGKIVSAEKYL